MIQYRFITPRRSGKWYPDLETAQKQAGAIGAGFFEARTGTFYQYRGTMLETRVLGDCEMPGQQMQGMAA